MPDVVAPWNVSESGARESLGRDRSPAGHGRAQARLDGPARPAARASDGAFEVGSIDQYVREDELECAHPVLRAVEATMLEHIHHFDEVGDDIVFEPYYRLGWDIRDSGWGVDVVQIPGPASAEARPSATPTTSPSRRRRCG